jgi:mannose-1-phosphate guanylyltransferase
VVETPDALLICPRERSQEVKKIVEVLEKKGEISLL